LLILVTIQAFSLLISIPDFWQLALAKIRAVFA
jgi:hypothetical protein